VKNARAIAISSATQTVGRVVTAAIGLVTVAITTRYLGLEVYGQLATVSIFLSVFMVLTDAGFINVTVRELSKNPDRSRQILGNVLALRSGAGLVIALLSAGLGSLLYRSGNQANVRLGIAVLSGTLLLSAVQTTFTTVIQARIENYLLVVGELANKLVVLAGVLWAMRSGGGFYGVVLAYLVGAVAWFVSDVWLALRRERPTLVVDPMYLRGLVVATIPYSAAVIINTLYFRADGFLLSVMRDSTQVGLYSVGYKVVELTMSFPIFFAMAMLPVLSAATSRERLAAVVRKGVRVLGLFGTGVTLGVIALAPEVAVLLGGAPFRAAAIPLAILMGGNFFIYQSMVYMQSLLASENQAAILRVNATLLVVNVAINLVLIPLYGSAGAAAAVLVSELLSLVMLRRFFAQQVGRPDSWYMALRPLGPGLVMFAAVVWLKGVLAGAGLSNMAVLAVAAAVGAVVYSAGIWLTRQLKLSEVRMLLRPQEGVK
jgi:O-antigen/teichoic acid export membrane protein